MRWIADHANNGLTALLALLCVAVSPSTANSFTRNPIDSVYSLANVTIHSSGGRVNALSHFDLSFALSTTDLVKLSLEPNHDIFPPDGLFVNVLDKEGRLVSSHVVDRLAHKVYKGKTWTKGPNDKFWIPAGYSRVTLHRDGQDPLFEGVFSVDNDNHHVQTVRNYLQTRHADDPDVDDTDYEHMVMYRDSDILREPTPMLGRSVVADSIGCAADRMHFNSMPEHPVLQEISGRSISSWGTMSVRSLFGKRQIDSSTGGNSAGVNLVSTIGSMAGCPTTRKVALVGVAADCTYRTALGSLNATQQNIINQMNQASQVYETSFDITLGLANLTVMDPECPATPSEATPWNQACSPSFDIGARLNTFSAWRGNLKDNNSHWTLLSTCPTNSEVGLAWLGQACVNTAQTSNTTNSTGGASTETVSGANVVIRTEGVSEWQIIAHETGHTFGAVHDCTAQTCANSQTVSSSQCCPLSSGTCDAGEKYIMNPSTGSGITNFSPCSIGNICSAMGRNSVRSSCLTDNSNVHTFSGPICGNGIVEPGEQCDCGGVAGCGNNTCCDPTTCKFMNNAVCDDSNSDCCHQCQFTSAGTVCRASTSVCDPQEVCPGNSSSCPADILAPNGQNCGSGLQCASGQCTSRDQQCQSVMGTHAANNDTHACDSQGCSISCASPSFGPGVCYEMPQNFLDGTTCGGGGSCSNGLCEGTTVGGEIKSWIDDNRNLVIGLAVAIGCLVLFFLFSCIYRCFRRRPVKTIPPPPAQAWQRWDVPQPNVTPPPEGYYGGGAHVYPPKYSAPPPPMESSMSGGNGMSELNRVYTNRSNSARWG